MGRLTRGGRRVLRKYVVRPLWEMLTCYGAVYVGPEAMPQREPRRPSKRSDRRLLRYARGRFLTLPPGVGGPPPAHPERLCQDSPLSAQELVLARDLWPTYEPRARDSA
ncbi:hypothetical protein SAMN06272735_8684 [Streptomyces sp. TLI_55]|uniref:DUF6059 family protein n=1 Tax=Streptomyces sp. TLI_55 TaxID=1938861 RepID=UPI000BD65EE5|nr:DUF6059 family protein [Streptomyces sp. TLI_55]SNX88245.1 hypothetical protein SAMN06272735_8684 [Streptomyces sp. TLI_55]